MVGVLEVRTSVLPASRNTSKGLDRYNCCHNISEVDTACPELAGDVQYRRTLLRCLALLITPHCLTGREPMPHRAFERCIDEFRKQMREPQNPQYDYDIVLCKRSKPLCAECPLRKVCAYGRTTAAAS